MLTFLIPIIVFLGIFIGILLKKIAKEEVKFGKYGPKYLIWMKRIILFILIITILFFTTNYSYLTVGIIIGAVLGIFITEYFFLGLSIVIGFFLNKDILLLTSTLTFLYGLPYGSILRNISLNQILTVTLFFFISFTLRLTNLDLNLIIGTSIAGLFQYLIKK